MHMSSHNAAVNPNTHVIIASLALEESNSSYKCHTFSQFLTVMLTKVEELLSCSTEKQHTPSNLSLVKLRHLNSLTGNIVYQTVTAHTYK